MSTDPEAALALLKQKQKHQLEMLMLQQEHEMLLEQARIKQMAMEKKQAEMQADIEAKMAALGMINETKQENGAAAPYSPSQARGAAAPAAASTNSTPVPAKMPPAEQPSAVTPSSGSSGVQSRYTVPGLHPEILVGKIMYWKGSTFGVIELPAGHSVEGQQKFQFHINQMVEGVTAADLPVGALVQFKIWVNEKLQKYANCVQPAAEGAGQNSFAAAMDRSAALTWRSSGKQVEEKENHVNQSAEGAQQHYTPPSKFHGSTAAASPSAGATGSFGPGVHDAWMRGTVSQLLGPTRGLISVYPDVNGSRELLFHASKAEVSMDQLTVGMPVEFKLFVDDQLKMRANQVRPIAQADAAAAAASPTRLPPPKFGAGVGAGVAATPSPSLFTPNRQVSAPGGPALFDTSFGMGSPAAPTPQSASADSEQARLRKLEAVRRVEEQLRQEEYEIQRRQAAAAAEARRVEEEQAAIEAAFAAAAQPSVAPPAHWSALASKLAAAPSAAPAAASAAAAKPSGPQLYPGMTRGTLLQWKDSSLGVVSYGEGKQVLCHVDQLLCSPSDLTPGCAIQFVLFHRPDGRQFAEGVQPLGWTPTTGMEDGWYRGVIRLWTDDYHGVISTRLDGLQRGQLMFHVDQRAAGVEPEELTEHTRVKFRVFHNHHTNKKYANDVTPI